MWRTRLRSDAWALCGRNIVGLVSDEPSVPDLVMAEEKSGDRRVLCGAVFLLIVLSSAVLLASIHGFLVLVSLMTSPRRPSSVLPVKHDFVIPKSSYPKADLTLRFLGSTPLPLYNFMPYAPSENAPSLPPNIDEIGVPEGSPEETPHLQLSVISPIAVTTKPMRKPVQQLMPSLPLDSSFHYIGAKSPFLSPTSPSKAPDGKLGLVGHTKAPNSKAPAQSPAAIAVFPGLLAPRGATQGIAPTPPPDITKENPSLGIPAPPIKAFAPAEPSKSGNVFSSSSLPPPIPSEGRNHQRPPNIHAGGPLSQQIPPFAPKAPLKLSDTEHAAPSISAVSPSLGVDVSSPVSFVPKTSPAVRRRQHISPAPAPLRVVSDHSGPPNIHSEGSVASPPLISPTNQWNQYSGPTSAPPRAFSEHSRPPTIHWQGESPGPLGVLSLPPSLSSEPHVSSKTNGPSSASSSPLPSRLPVVNPPSEGTIMSPHASIAPSTSRVHKKRIINHVSSAPSYSFPPQHEKGPFTSPSPSHTPPDRAPIQPPVWRWHKQHAAPPVDRGIYSHSSDSSPLPSMGTPTASSGLSYPPKVSPSPLTHIKPTKPVMPVPSRLLPPPPPNRDCEQFACAEPYTNTSPGSPCGCVLPIQVGLRLSVALYTFFPLVSEFALEVSFGVNMNVSQARIMGANADSRKQDKTIVNIDLVPMTRRFDPSTAFSVYMKFWHKMVAINMAFFGDYETLYVRYPGLPPSPPSAQSDITFPSFPGNSPQIFKPIGVDVSKHRLKLGGSLIAIIVLSSAVVLVLCLGVLWFFIFKHRDRSRSSQSLPRGVPSTLAKPSGSGSPVSCSGPSSVSLSFASSIGTYTGSAKTFTLSEMQRATNNFDRARILGEGGFGRVYSGVLEDGKRVAVKVLKRDDQQGGREFLAEVEMLSRLHHRNLVKLIGICTKEQNRCLVYELVPNGSVESHLHGVDKEMSPLDWDARVKIALGAARGLAYLHEDSNPRVIHRDFKSSNILLEDDFTPKVSDFGLARAAVEEGNEHISTRVMGTFGYVAPEYAMTGHLLVKSDVYSYGVVILELLTGRKPVDRSQPQGQENLVVWGRPFLTSKEGLEMIIDPALSGNYPFDSVAKLAAIASMCVQPEVSHRPFMGEVVQALKLVYNDIDEKDVGSGSCSQEQLPLHDVEFHTSFAASVHTAQAASFSVGAFDHSLEARWPLSVSGLLSSSARFNPPISTSFRWNSSSGPLRTNSRQPFWQRLRELSSGTASEHGIGLRSLPGLRGGLG